MITGPLLSLGKLLSNDVPQNVSKLLSKGLPFPL
jgi:hypothetical protein